MAAMSFLPRSLRRLLALFLLSVAGLFAAEPAKRPLTAQDFDAWRSIATPLLSRDGRWLAYSFMPQSGNGELVVRELATGRERREPVGALPPPPFPPPEQNNPEAPPPTQEVLIKLTSDSAFLVATTFPTKEEQVTARKKKLKPEDAPNAGLLILNLATGDKVRVASVKSMHVPARGGAWLAYLKEPRPDALKSAAGKKAPEPKSTEKKEPKKEFGSDLVLRDLAKGTERVFANVLDYTLARDGRTLLFTVSAKNEKENGVYAVKPGDSKAPVALLTGKGKYLKLAWDRAQTQAAFVSNRDDAESKSPRFKAYLWTRGAKSAEAVVSSTTPGVPAGMSVSDKAAPAFSRDGKKLYLGVAVPPKPPADPDAPTDSEEKVTADLWRWNDDFVQPMQKIRATQERNRSYRGALDLATRRYTQLADATLPNVTLSDDGTRALGFDDRASRRLADFDGLYSDVYLVDATTGTRHLVLPKLRSGSGNEGSPALHWSPNGQWAAYYHDRQWRVLNTADGSSRDLTSALPVAFYNEEHDLPEPASTYGWAGWTKDGDSLLAYDRYDVWQLFADGRPARNLTLGAGRTAKIQLRVQNIAPQEEGDDERGLDPAKPLCLRGESEETRATGFFLTTFDAAQPPRRALWGDKKFAYAGRALAADVLLLTASRFDEFPDVHTTDASFTIPAKVTGGGAQLAPFLWGQGELISFRNADGVPLRAALYKPADFDPAKKYPLIVYIYERLSQNVHTFTAPAPGHNINPSVYTSNGYLLLMPDIVYTIGHPGQSALKCVLPALDAAIKLGCVDEHAVGIQGHSWGGYQIAYMLTQTDRFRAAEAGAPVGNMTSAYGGIRWGPGQPRLFQYEKTQSRIGPPLTDAPELYLENSAVFHIKNVHTPLLILANDHDDAVPWYQGVELFLALRRHGKQAWLFNYNSELHGLKRRADQKDYALRLRQFFDHYLKGAPAPEWLEKGIPYIDRDEEKERFNAGP
jgi:dipeptidyl aminopeptidase/acylaminoacyl peptidase